MHNGNNDSAQRRTRGIHQNIRQRKQWNRTFRSPTLTTYRSARSRNTYRRKEAAARRRAPDIKMTTFQAWVLLRTFLRSRIELAQARQSRHRFYPRLNDAIAIVDAALGYADSGASYGFSRLDAWRECRRLAMRFSAYLPSPIRLRQKPFYVRMRRAVWTLDPVFGFDDKGLPFQCRYHGRLSRQDVTYGYIDGVYTQLCPYCGREAFQLFLV